MIKDWQKNSWIPATFLAVQGVTGILQIYIYSKFHSEATLLVLTIISTCLLLGNMLLLLAMYMLHVRKSTKLGSRTGDTSPGRGDIASSILEGVGEDNWPMKWLWIDRPFLIMAILVLIVGIAKVGIILDDTFFYKIPVTMMISSMLTAGLYLGQSVFLFAMDVRMKRRPRSMEAPPRLARSSGQPKEAREE